MKGMKGLELPLNMIVLIIIAVLVLLVIAAFFTSQTSGGFGSISDSAALDRGCQQWRANQCQAGFDPVISGYKIVDGQPTGTLSMACTSNGYDYTTSCRTRCVCPA